MADQRIFQKLKVDFSRNPELRFSQFFCERTPRRDLQNGMTLDPLPPLGAEPGAPKILGQLRKYPTSGFRGSKFMPPKIVNTRAYKFLGSHFRLGNGVLPPNPKNQFHLWDVFPENRWSDLDKIQNLHSSDNGSPRLSFW